MVELHKAYFVWQSTVPKWCSKSFLLGRFRVQRITIFKRWARAREMFWGGDRNIDYVIWLRKNERMAVFDENVTLCSSWAWGDLQWQQDRWMEREREEMVTEREVELQNCALTRDKVSRIKCFCLFSLKANAEWIDNHSLSELISYPKSCFGYLLMINM